MKVLLGDRIENPTVANRILAEVMNGPNGPKIGVGTGVPTDHAAEVQKAEDVGFSPEHQAELDRDRLATEALIRALNKTDSLDTLPVPTTQAGYSAAPPPADYPKAAATIATPPAWRDPRDGKGDGS